MRKAGLGEEGREANLKDKQRLAVAAAEGDKAVVREQYQPSPSGWGRASPASRTWRPRTPPSRSNEWSWSPLAFSIMALWGRFRAICLWMHSTNP